MNSRLTIQDLATLLAERTGKDRSSAEQFLREFVAVVSQGVFTDKLVKVKGFGTFKIIGVDKRESVHVNTGERFVIPAHYKFSFLPDKELRELVNKPFSFFETTELNEDIDFKELDISNATEDKDVDTEDESVEEIIPENEEIPVSVEVTQPEVQPEKEVPEEPAVTEETVETEVSIEAPESFEEEVNIIEEEVKPEDVEEVLEEPEESSEEENPEPEISEPEEELLPEEENADPEPTPSANDIPYKDNPFNDEVPKASPWMKVAVSLTVAVIAVAAGIFLYLHRSYFLGPEAPTPALTGRSLPETPVVIPKDTVQMALVDTVAPLDTVVVEPETPAPAPEVLAKVKIETGSRLTLISLEYYGSKIFWVYLYEYNKSVIKDPNNIPVGTEISVPAPSLYGIDKHSRASIEKAAARQTEILSGNL